MNQTSKSVINIQKLQELFGNYEIMKYFFMYALSPIGFLGLVLNIISLIIFKKKQLANKIVFNYIRYYLYTSIILCLQFFLGMFYCASPIFKFSDTFAAKFYAIRINFPIFSLFYFYNCFLDLIISIDRVSQFLPTFNLNKRFSHIRINVCLFLASLLLNASYFSVYSPAQYDFHIGANTTYSIFYTDLSSYGRSEIGQINILTIYVLRDIITLFIGLGFNVLAIVLLRRFVNNKKKFMEANKDKSIKDVKHVNLNLNLMVITMSLFSSLEHFLFLITYLHFYISKSNNYISVLLNLISLTFIIFKQFSNFFIFLIFNRIFRCEFLNLVLRRNKIAVLNSSTRNNS